MDDFDMDSLTLPDMDGVEYEDVPVSDSNDDGDDPWKAKHTVNPNRPAQEAEDYELDLDNLPSIEEMSDLGSGAGKPGLGSEAELARSIGAPGIAEMKGTPGSPKPAAPMSPVSPTAAAPMSAPAGNTMSARERRMAEPMPGAYNPAEKNASPAPQQTNGTYQAATYKDTYYEKQERSSREDSLNAMYAERQLRHDQGAERAKILGYIVIGLAVVDFISEMANKYGGQIMKILNVVVLAVMIYSAVRFMKGSNKYRVMLGRLAAIDALFALINCKQTIDAIKALQRIAEMFGGETNDAAWQPLIAGSIIRAVLFTIGYGAMAYFFLLDNRVSDYTTDE